MEARTKLQKRVLELSQSMPGLTAHQRKLAIAQCTPHAVIRTAEGQYTCLDCGHTWDRAALAKYSKQDHKGIQFSHYTTTCPHCGNEAQVVFNGRLRKWSDHNYFHTLTTRGGMQVMRVFLISTLMRRGKPATYWVEEVFQKWLTADCKQVVVGYVHTSFTCRPYSWMWGSGWEVRRNRDKCAYSWWYDDCYCGGLVGTPRVLPALRRNGFDGKGLELIGFTGLMLNLFQDTRFETMWKAGYRELAVACANRGGADDNVWAAFKIAARNKYRITDVPLWRDTVQMLVRLGRDIHNAKYVCPDDLKAAHDEAQRTLRRQDERRRMEERRKSMAEEEAQYQLSKKAYLGLVFSSGDIVVTPLQSVAEFYHEGEEVMHHCVFRCRYYAKDTSLVFHAKIGDKIIATIEYDLKSGSILQCRGRQNSIPEHDEEIRELLRQNRGAIARAGHAA